MRWPYVLGGFAVAALAGLGIFGVLLWGATTTRTATEIEAEAAFEEVLRKYPDREPMLHRDSAGKVAHSQVVASDGTFTHLNSLVYRRASDRIALVEAPFWFVKLKGPALQYVLRDTDYDLEELEITPRDLERYGPGVVIDDRHGNGDRILIWTE